MIFFYNIVLSQDRSINNTFTNMSSIPAYPAYRVKLSPTDDAHIEIHGGRFGTEVKMITTESEGNTLREMVKDHIGKTVGKVGALDGEQYEIMSTFPNISDLHAFVNGMKSKSVSFDTYYTEKYRKKANPSTSTTTYQCSPAMATCDGLYPPPPM